MAIRPARASLSDRLCYGAATAADLAV